MRLFGMLALLSLTACNSANPPGDDTCGATDAAVFVGSPLPDGAFDEREEAVRILPPGSVVTMDFRAERLNVELDANDRVIRVYCG